MDLWLFWGLLEFIAMHPPTIEALEGRDFTSGKCDFSNICLYLHIAVMISPLRAGKSVK